MTVMEALSGRNDARTRNMRNRYVLLCAVGLMALSVFVIWGTESRAVEPTENPILLTPQAVAFGVLLAAFAVILGSVMIVDRAGAMPGRAKGKAARTAYRIRR